MVGARLLALCTGGSHRDLLYGCIAVVRQLLDVLYQAVKLPLSVDLASASQRETVQLLVASEVAKHRLHGGEASRDHLASVLGVDFALHALARLLFCLVVLAHEDGHLSHLTSLRMA